MEKHLASGLIKGIGPALAQRLVQHFGTDVLKIIEDSYRFKVSLDKGKDKGRDKEKEKSE